MDFKSALNKICQDFNKEIIFERRIISILDDYGAFKDVPYYKLYYKTALSSGNLLNLLSRNNNISDKALFTFVSLTGLDENKTKLFLSIICECYYGIIPNPISNCKNNVNDPENNKTSSRTDNSTLPLNPYSAPDGDHIVFMGKELGCDAQEMCEHLLNRGFSRFTGLGNIKVKGDFAGIKDVLINIWPTPTSSKVWKIVVTAKCDYVFLKKMYSSKYSSFDTEVNHGYYLEKVKFTTQGGVINLSKCIGHNENLIEYTDTLTKELYSREFKQRDEMRRKQKELETNQKIRNGISDI